MKHLIFSRVPFHAFVFHKYLDKKNSYIITDSRFESGYEEAGYKQVFGFANYLKNDHVLKKAIEIVRVNKIDLIHSMDESDVERAAITREIFNITGQKTLSSILYRDKYLMKLMLKDIITVPKFETIETREELNKFIRTNGLPIVLKPRKSWASNDTYKINDIKELELINDFSGFMAENWIDNSIMYTVDGIQVNGKILWFTLHQYDKNILESIELQKDGFGMLTSPKNFDMDFRKKAKIYSEKIINKLNNHEQFTSAFHLEFFYTNDDKFIFCEIGSRFGGGKTIDLINISYGIELPSILMEILEGRRYDANDLKTIPESFAVCYKKYSLKNSIPSYIDNLKSRDWMVTYFENNPKNYKRKPENINDFEALYVFKAETYEKSIERLDLLEKGKPIKIAQGKE